MTHNEVAVQTPAAPAGTSVWRRPLSTKTVASVVAVVLVLIASPFAGKPWGWTPSYGGSYGETLHGLVWIKEEKVSPTTQLKVGDNVTYFYGHGAMKRIWFVSPDQQWFWVMGDNSGKGEGESGGSCEIGWICRPGTTSQPPTNPAPNPETKPRTPVVVQAKVVDFFSPFDRRSGFEKRMRFFNDPRDIIVSGSMLIRKGEKISEVYDRETGILKWKIPGDVRQVQGRIAKFMKPSAFIRDPIPGEFDLVTGEVTLAPEPKIADPKLRVVKLTETSGQNPVKVLDNNPSTAWYMREDCGKSETLTIKFPEPVMVKAVRVDGQYNYDTKLTVSVSLNGKKLAVSSGSVSVNCKIDTIELVFTQVVAQPIGEVKEVYIE